MTFGLHTLVLVIAILVFGWEAWSKRSVLALGLALFAAAFLVP